MVPQFTVTSLFAELWPGFHTEGGSAAGLEALPAGRAEATAANQPFADGPEDEITGEPRAQDQSRQPNGDTGATAPFLPAELLAVQDTRNGEETSALVLLSPWDEGTSSGGRSSGVMGGPDGAQTNSTGSGPAYEGLLVSWAPNSSASARAQARQALNLSLRETIHTAAMQSSGAGVLEWVDLPPGLSAEQAIANLSRRPGVAYAEKNWRLESQVTSNDFYTTKGRLWGMSSEANRYPNPYGSQAEAAWAANYTGSSVNPVYVGIIDEGYQYTHSDLAANAGTNPNEIAGNGKDDDGNGYVDDVYGWDFNGNNNSVYDGTSDDHGTHVAGTIGAIGANGSGVAGINWNVKLLNAKFLGSNGGTTANAVKAVDYFTNLKSRYGLPIVATNNSWGGGSYSQALHDAIIRAAYADILFVAAAGNSTSNNDTTASYPSNYNTRVGTTTQAAASYDSVIAVASITSAGGISSFSSYGNTTVDLGAPGSDIWSTLPGSPGSYGSYSGTSMATPHVTGAAALLKSIYPNASAADIKNALIQGTNLISALSGKTVSGGTLDITGAANWLQSQSGSVPVPISISNSTITGATEGSSSIGSFTLTRTNTSAAGLTVNLRWDGWATLGVDYDVRDQSGKSLLSADSYGNSSLGSINFANSSSITLTIAPINDSKSETVENIILTVTKGIGYTVATASASLSVVDNDSQTNVSTTILGTNLDDKLKAWSSTGNTIWGVPTSGSGTSTGKDNIDWLEGGSSNTGADKFILADSRGTFYNDGDSANQGWNDYALISGFNKTYDKIQLKAGSQYIIRNNGLDTELFLGDGNMSFSSSDELIAKIQGVNLASSTNAALLGTSNSWTTFV